MHPTPSPLIVSVLPASIPLPATHTPNRKIYAHRRQFLMTHWGMLRAMGNSARKRAIASCRQLQNLCRPLLLTMLWMQILRVWYAHRKRSAQQVDPAHVPTSIRNNKPSSTCRRSQMSNIVMGFVQAGRTGAVQTPACTIIGA